MDNLFFSVSIIFPIFALIILGVILRRLTFINADFVKSANKVIFSFAMPVLVFQKMRTIEAVPFELITGILVFLAITVFIIIASWLLVSKSDPPSKASAVQGAYRSNLAIVGLAVIQNLLSDRGAAFALVLITIIVPAYNLFAVMILSFKSGQKFSSAFLSVIRGISRNPLIWGILMGLVFALFNLPVPVLINTTLDYFARLTLPLALICIGGSLQISGLLNYVKYWGFSVCTKLLVLPVAMYAAASLFGFSSDIRTVLVIEAACPVAVTSFVMADAYGANSRLAGEIVSISTILSALTLPVWIWILL